MSNIFSLQFASSTTTMSDNLNPRRRLHLQADIDVLEYDLVNEDDWLHFRDESVICHSTLSTSATVNLTEAFSTMPSSPPDIPDDAPSHSLLMRRRRRKTLLYKPVLLLRPVLLQMCLDPRINHERAGTPSEIVLTSLAASIDLMSSKACLRLSLPP